MAYPALPRHAVEVVGFPDWSTVDEAAAVLDRSPARVRQMIELGNFKTIAKLGDRPTYLLKKSEVAKVAGLMEKRKAKPSRG